MRILICLPLFALTACTGARFDAGNLASAPMARRCIIGGSSFANEHCVGKSISVVARYIGDETFELARPEASGHGEFIVEGTGAAPGDLVQLMGVVQDAGVFSLRTLVRLESAEAVALTVSERAARDAPTPEEQIQENRRKGALALEEADAAIRANNVDMKARLAAAAVAHQMADGPEGLRVDVYTLADGRTVGCTTKAGAAGPAITSCDGEP